MQTETVIKAATIFTDRKSSMPILRGIACNGSVTATDLESSIRLPAIDGITGVYEPSALSFKVQGHDVRDVMPLEEYPMAGVSITERVIARSHGHVRLIDLGSLFAKHLLSASSDASRLSLCCICINSEHIVSADGHRLLCSPINDGFKLLEKDRELLITTDFAAKMVKLSKLFKKEHVSLAVTVHYRDNGTTKDGETLLGGAVSLSLSSPEMELHTRLIDAQYPDYRQILRGLDFEASQTFNISLQALPRLKKETKDIREKDRQVRGRWNTLSLTRLDSAGIAHVKQEHDVFVPVHLFTGKTDLPVSTLTRCSRKYLVEALMQLSADKVLCRIQIKDDLGPILLSDGVDVALIMPVRESSLGETA